jgi:hypothetical protein
MSEQAGERQWVVEPPPSAGEVALFVAFGDGVELTPEQYEALNSFIATLEQKDAEVAGYVKVCPKQGPDCGPLICHTLQTGGCSAYVAGTSTTSSWSLMGTFGSTT